MWNTSSTRWCQASWKQFSSLPIKSAISRVILSPSVAATSYLRLPPSSFSSFDWSSMCDDRESVHLISRSLLPEIRKNLKCSNQVILGAIGYTRIVKVHFLRKSHVSSVNLRWPTVYCFITTEMAYLPRKIIMISHSYKLINAHLKNIMFPSVTLYKSLPYVYLTCMYDFTLFILRVGQ